MHHSERLRIALVYPPFAPNRFPSLGLASLSAGLKGLGFECRTFHWNLQVIRQLPGTHVHQQWWSYEQLSKLAAFPLSEWIFTDQVYSDFRPDEAVLQALLRGAQSKSFTWAVARRFLGEMQAVNKRLPKSRRFSTRFDMRPRELLFGLKERAGELVERMADQLSDFEIVGINTSFLQNLPALALARRVKARWPEKTVVLGGANCEGEMGEALLEHFPFLDYVFAGEVDFSFPDFVRRLSRKEPVDQVPGIIYRDASGRRRTGPAAMPLQDMDSLPVPDFDDYVAEREALGISSIRKLFLALESSRGCWWGAKQHCTFCGLNANGMAYRQKSQERFQWELEQVVRKYGTRFIAMTDNILSMKYFKEFMDWSRERQLEVDLFYEIKSNLDREQVTKLAQARVSMVQPGIESFSSDVLTLMRKGVTGIQNVAFLKYATENGMRITYSILFGFPGEDPREYQRMAREVRKLVHLEPPLSVGPISYHRFSPYQANPADYGLELRPSPRYRVLYPFREDEVARIAYRFERTDTPRFTYAHPIQRRVVGWRRDHTRRSSAERMEYALSWTDVDHDILIRDRRIGFPRRDYRLRNGAVRVFHELDSPTALKTVIRRLANGRESGPDGANGSGALGAGVPGSAGNGVNHSPSGFWHRKSRPLTALWNSRPAKVKIISFEEEAFTREPEACLAPMVDAGLLWVEDGRYLALPVRDDPNRRRLSVDDFI
jgi:ribosomal peptide maturation radical SAM protein 1